MSERDLFGDDSPPAKRKVVAWGYAAPAGPERGRPAVALAQFKPEAQ